MSAGRAVRPWPGDRGQAAGAEAIAFGLLVFVAIALVLANAWAVVDARLAAGAAAREAVRVVVESDEPENARGRAVDLAVEVLRAHGGLATAPRVELHADGPVRRCARITAVVRTHVPAISVPFVGGLGRGLEVRASHSEVVDPYRSGPRGEADCGP